MLVSPEYNAIMSDDRMAAAFVSAKGEESPGSTGSGCRVTPGGGNPRESATENKPPDAENGHAGKGEKVR